MCVWANMCFGRFSSVSLWADKRQRCYQICVSATRCGLSKLESKTHDTKYSIFSVRHCFNPTVENIKELRWVRSSYVIVAVCVVWVVWLHFGCRILPYSKRHSDICNRHCFNKILNCTFLFSLNGSPGSGILYICILSWSTVSLRANCRIYRAWNVGQGFNCKLCASKQYCSYGLLFADVRLDI